MVELRSLRTREEFDKVFRHGVRWRAQYLNVVYLTDSSAPADQEANVRVSVGIAVSRRFGNAVERNRFRRRLREVVRGAELPAGSYFFSPRRSCEEITFAGLKDDITRLCVEGLSCGLKKVTNER